MTPTTTVPTTASAPKLLELCEQYFIAGWLSSQQYEDYRKQIQIMIQNTTSRISRHSHRSNGIELLTQQIQNSISTAQKKEEEEEQELPFDENKNKKSTATNTSVAVTTNEPLIYTPLEFQKKIVLQNSGHNSTNINIKELFVEMCFYARLAYVQPPCCLHCTYTGCYTPTKKGNDVTANGGKPQPNTNKAKLKTVQNDIQFKCHRYVVWRMDTNIIYHPDTIATNIVILPCYLVQQLLQNDDGSNNNNNNEPPPPQQQQQQNSGKIMIESTNYQYDPIHKSITLK